MDYEDKLAYEYAKRRIIDEHDGICRGRQTTYTVEGKYIFSGEFALPVKGFATSEDNWEILRILNFSQV